MPATGSNRLSMDETSVVAPTLRLANDRILQYVHPVTTGWTFFSILDPVTNLYLALTDVTLPKPDPNFALQEQYILNSQALNKRYRKVFICVDSPAYTLLPISLFDEERVGSLFALNGIKLSPDDKVLRNNIEMVNSTTAFTIPNFLYFFLRTQFPNADIFHSTTPVISSMLLKRQGSVPTNQNVHVCLADNCMTVTAVENNELKLCNTFYCREVPDYTYMLLYAVEQLNFNLANVHFTISGNIPESDKRLATMRRFLPDMQMASLPTFFDYGFIVPERQYKFNALFLLPLCA